MKRREFITLASSAAVALPIAVRAQASVPVIGYLASASAAAPSGPIDGIYLGLKQAGYEVGKNARMEHRYADNRADRLPALAADLVTFPANLIITSGGPAAAVAAKNATTTIPIVFAPLSDPVQTGIVASLNSPGGNITGVAALTVELDPKRLELLHELAPEKGPLGVMFNPARIDTQLQLDNIKATALSLGREMVAVSASKAPEIDAAFAELAQRSIVGFLVAADAFFSSQRHHIVSLANQHHWPAVYQWREFVEAGGLANFGPNLFDSYRQVGLFAARILNGEKPANLPVQQPSKFELVINLKTARSLGINVPLTLLARADAVIE